MKCPECGEENPGNAIFCMICGARFTAGGGQPVTPEATRPLQQVPEPAQPFHPERVKGQTMAALPSHATQRRSAPPSPLFAPPPTRCTSRDHPCRRRAWHLRQHQGRCRSPGVPLHPHLPTEASEEPLPSPQKTIPLHPLPGFLLDARDDMPSSLQELVGQVDYAGPPTESYPPPSARPTTPMAPVTMPPASTARVSEKVVCPQCYAQNPRGNLHCQECGSTLPSILTGATRAMAPQAPVPSSPMPAVVPRRSAVPQARAPGDRGHAGTNREGPGALREKGESAPAGKSRTIGFGPADGLAIFAILSIGAAISPLFKWMEGTTSPPSASRVSIAREGRPAALRGHGMVVGGRGGRYGPGAGPGLLTGEGGPGAPCSCWRAGYP